MRYRHITEGIFLSRPNRFIARVMIGGEEETVHVKNTGRCRELLVPGATVYLERSQNPSRKTAYDLVAVEKEGLGLVNMDSQAPNRVVGEWLAARQMKDQGSRALEGGLSGDFPGEETAKMKDLLMDEIFPGPVTLIHPEYSYGSSRVDFYFECGRERCLMEVKGVTLERDGIAYFPDAPTERGVKHIKELESALEEGYHGYLAFVIQMPGIMQVYPNDETHPAFGEALRRACRKGVQVLALGCEIRREELWISRCRKLELAEQRGQSM